MARMRGIVGIEAAIVLIAFVLVASALAFVAINMGMFASQKSKEVMAKAYDSATRALDIAGDTIAHVAKQTQQTQQGTTTTVGVDAIFIPVRLTAGTNPIDLNKTVVSLVIQKPDGTGFAVASAVAYPVQPQAVTALSDIQIDQLDRAAWYMAKGNNNNLLGPGELAILAIKVSDANGNPLPAYSTIQVEIKPPVGAPLVAKYEVPPVLTSDYVDLVLGG